MTTTEQLERALVAIREKGDKFAPLMPDKIQFEFETILEWEHLDLIDKLQEELVKHGYIVHRWSDCVNSISHFTALKQP